MHDFPNDDGDKAFGLSMTDWDAFVHLGREVAQACVSPLVDYDFARAALACEAMADVSLSEDCREQAEDVCDAEEAMLSHERDSVAFFERCLEAGP
jgi:hypothetical protein